MCSHKRATYLAPSTTCAKHSFETKMRNVGVSRESFFFVHFPLIFQLPNTKQSMEVGSTSCTVCHSAAHVPSVSTSASAEGHHTQLTPRWRRNLLSVPQPGERRPGSSVSRGQLVCHDTGPTSAGEDNVQGDGRGVGTSVQVATATVGQRSPVSPLIHTHTFRQAKLKLSAPWPAHYSQRMLLWW